MPLCQKARSLIIYFDLVNRVACGEFITRFGHSKNKILNFLLEARRCQPQVLLVKAPVAQPQPKPRALSGIAQTGNQRQLAQVVKAPLAKQLQGCWLNNHLPSQQCGRQYLKYDCRGTIKIVDPALWQDPASIPHHGLIFCPKQQWVRLRTIVGDDSLTCRRRYTLLLSTGKIL